VLALALCIARRRSRRSRRISHSFHWFRCLRKSVSGSRGSSPSSTDGSGSLALPSSSRCSAGSSRWPSASPLGAAHPASALPTSALPAIARPLALLRQLTLEPIVAAVARLTNQSGSAKGCLLAWLVSTDLRGIPISLAQAAARVEGSLDWGEDSAWAQSRMVPSCFRASGRSRKVQMRSGSQSASKSDAWGSSLHAAWNQSSWA
jgi:hypothetical protein